MIHWILQYFVAVFIERFIFGVEIRFNLGEHFFVGAKCLTQERSFYFREQIVIAGSQIRKIRRTEESNSKRNSRNFAVVAIDLWIQRVV